MAFVRVSRDKRGYEHIYLVDMTVRRGKPARSRVLYWFRTPPGVMVGREPFDEPVRRALEAQYPDVLFDWETLRKTAAAAPPPDVEHWRERRRMERAAKQTRQADERHDSETERAEGVTRPTAPDGDIALDRIVQVDEPDGGNGREVPPARLPDLEPRPSDEETSVLPADEGQAPLEATTEALPSVATVRPPDHRRRRRGGRRRRPSSGAGATPASTPSDPPKESEPQG